MEITRLPSLTTILLLSVSYNIYQPKQQEPWSWNQISRSRSKKRKTQSKEPKEISNSEQSDNSKPSTPNHKMSTKISTSTTNPSKLSKIVIPNIKNSTSSITASQPEVHKKTRSTRNNPSIATMSEEATPLSTTTRPKNVYGAERDSSNSLTSRINPSKL